MFEIDNLLRQASELNASDVHLVLDKVPALRISGSIKKLELPPLTEEDFDSILNRIVPKDAIGQIKELFDADFTYEVEGLSRYRVNYCREMGRPKLTMRLIPYTIPTFAELNLPQVIENFTHFNNGIVLVTGATGSGKSTTIASMIEYINCNMSKHVITIEDPIEFIYTDKNSLITQRGLGIDVHDFSSGVKYALRQDPDIILIGEIRDAETVESAVQAAETGHLVLSTIHTNSAVQTINRIIGLFDSSKKEFMRKRIAQTIKGTIAQKLLKKKEGGFIPALEMMASTPTIEDYIIKDKLYEVQELITRSNNPSIFSMNSSICNLVKQGYIDRVDALKASDNEAELNQMLRGAYRGTSEIGYNNII